MLLILRRIKRNFFANKQFHNYLLYAAGEILLVVIGILIALNIDNWNDDKQREQTLLSYLDTIATNIDDDLAKITAIRTTREIAYEVALRTSSLMEGQNSFSRAEIAFAGEALARARQLHYFIANTSGYEALKSSGVLGRLQGKDIENLLYDYYNTVSRIAHNEQGYNRYVQALSLQVITQWPKGLEQWEIDSPKSMPENIFQAAQPRYVQLMNARSTSELLANAQRPVAHLLRDYDRLEHIGTIFADLVDNGQMDFDQATVNRLASLYDLDSGIGNPNVISDGQITWHSYDLTHASSNYWQIAMRPADQSESGEFKRVLPYDSLELRDGSVQIHYRGGADWAGIWFVVPHSLGRQPYLDYSVFDTLQVEIKGERGGETILLNLEDADDPLDGSSTRYPLQLTEQWQTYEIDLADFETADLSKLQTIFGFVFLTDAQSFSVKNVRYIKRE